MIWRLEGNDDEVFEANLNTAKDIQNRQQLPGFVNSSKVSLFIQKNSVYWGKQKGYRCIG